MYQIEVREMVDYRSMWDGDWNFNWVLRSREIRRERLLEMVDEWVMARENRERERLMKELEGGYEKSKEILVERQGEARERASKTLIEEVRKVKRETLMEEDKGDETNDWGRTREIMLRACEQMASNMGLPTNSQPGDLCSAILYRLEWLSASRICTMKYNLGKLWQKKTMLYDFLKCGITEQERFPIIVWDGILDLSFIIPNLFTENWMPPASDGDKHIAVENRIALLTKALGKSYKDTAQKASVSARNNRSGPAERSILPINLNGKTYHALADTMASMNVMSEEHAISIGAIIDRSPEKQHTFVNAVGKSFRALGDTAMEVSFPNDPSEKKTWETFAVVKNCAAALVMGDPFLRMTETLSKFRHRLKKVTRTVKQCWRLCYMDVPHRQLNCSVDGDAVLANTDTGSEIDLVSLEYANRRGWHIKRLGPRDGIVELADGSIVKLSGYVEARLDVAGESSQKTFYVLDKLQCDVLLGDETLDSLDAFNLHESLFVDRDDDVDGLADFHAIKWKERVNDRVSQILENKLPPAFVSGAPSLDPNGKNVWKRLLRRVSGVSPAEEMKAWELAFERSLEFQETVETDRQNQANRQIESLSGEDAQSAKAKDDNARRQYAEKKKRILAQRQEFLARWSAVNAV